MDRERNDSSYLSELDHAFVVALAGGMSSRLFPFNKVLSDLEGRGRSLAQSAYDRATSVLARGPYSIFVRPDRFYVLTVPTMVLSVRAQLKLPSSHIFVDPTQRGTFPAILWAMAHLSRSGMDESMVVITSDHVIPNVRAFRAGVIRALTLAQSEPAVALLGVTPTTRVQDWLSFGCLKMDRRLSPRSNGPRRITMFEEKPLPERAAGMIAEPGWIWNAGMFVFRISTVVRALRRHQPWMASVYEVIAIALARGDVAKARAAFKDFPSKIPHPQDSQRLVDNTIDYALMPYLVAHPGEDGSLWVVPNALPGWADVGEWNALRNLVGADGRGNVKSGSVKLDPKTRQCIVAADRGLSVEVKRLQNAVVAFSDSTAFLFPADQKARVKSWVDEIRGRPREKVVQLDCGENRVVTKGGRVAVCGMNGLEIHLNKNRLRVVGSVGVL